MRNGAMIFSRWSFGSIGISRHQPPDCKPTGRRRSTSFTPSRFPSFERGPSSFLMLDPERGAGCASESAWTKIGTHRLCNDRKILACFLLAKSGPEVGNIHAILSTGNHGGHSHGRQSLCRRRHVPHLGAARTGSLCCIQPVSYTHLPWECPP